MATTTKHELPTDNRSKADAAWSRHYQEHWVSYGPADPLKLELAFKAGYLAHMSDVLEQLSGEAEAKP